LSRSGFDPKHRTQQSLFLLDSDLYPRDQMELIDAELVLAASSVADGHVGSLPQLDSIALIVRAW
jgi:hypothetical protein